MTSLPRAIRRRGVLLLVVLSMLTLFLMLGVTYLIAASRARETARAYARLTFGSDDVRIPAVRVLDSMLLRVIRGPVVATSGTFESLLADKYGAASLAGTVTGLSRTGPMLSANVSTGSSVRPTDLVGRVLTLAKLGCPVTSHRIVRALGSGLTNAETTSFTLTLDMPTGCSPLGLPAVPVPAVVNGREFAGVPSGAPLTARSNENWDGFDAHNLFLAQLRSSTSSISQSDVVRGSFLLQQGAANTFVVRTSATTSGTYTFVASAASAFVERVTGTTDIDGDLIMDAADNDGDGVIDGVFQDYGIPLVTDAAGNTVRLHASVLVVDLDGRFNVNAHDALPRLVYAGTNRWTTTVSTSAAPLGSGYGPAEINGLTGTRVWTNNSTSTSGTGLFPGPSTAPGASMSAPLQSAATFATGEHPTVFALTGGPTSRFMGLRSGTTGSRYTDAEFTFQLRPVEGRYGERAASSWASIIGGDLASPSSSSFAVPGQPATDDEASRMSDRRAPQADPSSIGYGVPPVWWLSPTGATTGSNFNWGSSPVVSGSTLPLPRGVFNSPPDLHGRMKTITGTATGLAPVMTFAKVEWADAATNGTRETTDDPYELRLDTRRGFGGMLFDPTTAGSGTSASSLARDNPFTPAELEPVLRPYDVDTNKHQPRLAAMLGSAAEEARLKVTTDSWDTTAITGSAALVLFGPSGTNTGWLQQVTGTIYSNISPVQGIIANEVSRGERFDLNRPLTASGTANAGYDPSNIYYVQRQAYFKDLYTLLFALDRGSGGSAPAAEIAQWVANAIEFRDADSIMTPFEYDTDPANGWDVDGDVRTDEGPPRSVAFGVERPEILIAETLAWERVDPSTTGTTGGMCISLHRPWNAVATGTGSVQIAGEPCDYALDTLSSGGSGRPINQVDLGKKPHAVIMGTTNSLYDDLTNAAYPIWRLRIVSDGGTQYVRFDTNTAGANELLISGTATPGTALQSGDEKPKLPINTTFTFFSGTTGTAGTTPFSFALTGSSRVAQAPGTFRVAGGPPSPFNQVTRSGTVFLERLANPSIPATAAIWSATPLATSTTTGTIPQQYVVVDSATMSIINTGTQPTPTQSLVSTRRDASSATTSPWRMASTSTAVLGTYPTLASSTTTGWMPWPNRPFVSSAELTLVPRGHALGMLQNYTQLTPLIPTGTAAGAIGIPIAPQLLFDAVHVPSRFAGIHQTYTGDLSATTGIFSTGSNAITTVNQLSSFREPGRVNLNTVPSDDVWNAVVAGQLPGPIVSRTDSTITTVGPAESMYATLSLASGTGTTIVSDTTAPQLAVNLNPLHRIYTATRLANTTTPRSNVFAVWITLRESVANDPDSVKYHRAFYIVDRSIPVGFEEGKDYNVWDCVRLRRIIE